RGQPRASWRGRLRARRPRGSGGGGGRRRLLRGRRGGPPAPSAPARAALLRLRAVRDLRRDGAVRHWVEHASTHDTLPPPVRSTVRQGEPEGDDCVAVETPANSASLQPSQRGAGAEPLDGNDCLEVDSQAARSVASGSRCVAPGTAGDCAVVDPRDACAAPFPGAGLPTPRRKRPRRALGGAAAWPPAGSPPDAGEAAAFADSDVEVCCEFPGSGDLSGPGRGAGALGVSVSAGIPCDLCGAQVPTADFPAHAAAHVSESRGASSSSGAGIAVCSVCGTVVAPCELADHEAAHRVHQELVEAELQQSTSEVDIAVQLVSMARQGGSGLLGNRRSMDPGDAILARWSDGHWYHGHLQSAGSGNLVTVSWDPPCNSWAPEAISVNDIMPRTEQAREVCNFDVAVAFVKKMRSMSEAAGSLEIVYHYTRGENVHQIVENSLKVPGTTNADGSKVTVKNGSVMAAASTPRRI
ncbi:unnamed protein product, partial [Prorocentrum cordatum]